MRKSIGIIIVALMVGVWFLVPAASGDRAEPPRKYCEEIDKKDFHCYDKCWVFSLTRDRVFRSLGLTKEQREEIGRLRKQFRVDLSALKRRHNESLLNVLDDDQRRKLEEKRGEIDRYFEEKTPHLWRIRNRSSYGVLPTSYILDEDWLDLNLLEVGTSKKLMESGIDPTTWSGIKKEFN